MLSFLLIACARTAPDSGADPADSDTGDPCVAPTVAIASPEDGARVPAGVAIRLAAASSAEEVAWLLDGVEIARGIEASWTPQAAGTYLLSATVADACGDAADGTLVTVYELVDASVTVFGAETGLPAAAWTGLSVGPDGRVWGSGSAGLVMLDPAAAAARTFLAVDGLLTDAPRAVLAHSDGTVWVGHPGDPTRQGEQIEPAADGSITVLRPMNVNRSADMGEISTVYRLREQPHGVGVGDIWAGTDEGLCVGDADLDVFEDHAHPTHPHGDTLGVAFTPDGHVWNGDEYWLSRWNYSNDGDLSPSADLAETVAVWPVEPAVDPVDIVDLDADGASLWVASSRFGVAVVTVSDTVGASTVELLAGDWPASASAIRADGAGNVWIGTATAGLYRWDGATLAHVTGSWLPSEVIEQIAVDATTSPPTVWIATPAAWIRVVGDPG